MATQKEHQEQFDDAMLDFSMADYDAAIVKLQRLLEADPDHFDARLALGMAHYRKGDYAQAIAEGHKAEAMRPHEQLVHTNLSLFYMRSGDKKTAEHHGLQARIASWREGGTSPPGETSGQQAGSELTMAGSAPAPMKFTGKLPEAPWKNKKSMKTAYELAMERLNKDAPSLKLTADQKKEIAELESRCKAKIAEKEMQYRERIYQAESVGDFALKDTLQHELVEERKKLEETLETQKDKVRQQAG